MDPDLGIDLDLDPNPSLVA